VTRCPDLLLERCPEAAEGHRWEEFQEPEEGAGRVVRRVVGPVAE
jgi:hypothetical protein